MKKNLINLAVAATLGLAAFAATADDMYRGAWYLVPGASYVHPDSDIDSRNGGGAFIRLGKEISESWDVQIGGGYARAGEDTNIAGAGGRYKQTLLGVDALYMFSRDKFRPFLLAGVGAARNKIDYSGVQFAGNDDSRTSAMVNLGLGMQYLFSDNFGLQADLRHVWSKADGKGIGASSSLDADGTVGNTYLNLGAIFRFGAPAPMPVAAAEPMPAPEPAPAPMVEPTPEPAPAPAPPVAACVPNFETVTISAEKLFGFDKAKLQDGAKPVLDATAEKIKANPELKLVMVTGHTDRLGSDSYNQKLSERRANVVKDYLVSQGVDASRLQTSGKGESEPVVTCNGAKSKKLIACLQPNRRVEITAEQQIEKGCK